MQVELSFGGEGKIDLSNFVPSGTWDVTSGIGHVNYYSDKLNRLEPRWAPTNRTDVTFNIKVHRKVNISQLLIIVHDFKNRLESYN